MPVVFISLAPGLSDDDTAETPGDAPVKPAAAGAEPEVPCTWCGFMTTAGPSCDRCGSPLPTSYAMSTDGSLVATRKKKVPPVVTITPKGTVNVPGATPGGRRPTPEPAPTLDWEHETVVRSNGNGNGNGQGRPVATPPTDAPPMDVPAPAAAVEAPAPDVAIPEVPAPPPEALIPPDQEVQPQDPPVASAPVDPEPPIAVVLAPLAPADLDEDDVFGELWGHATQVEEAGPEELSIQAIDAASQLAFEDRERTFLAEQRVAEDSPARPLEPLEPSAPEGIEVVEELVAEPIEVAEPEAAIEPELVVEPEPIGEPAPDPISQADSMSAEESSPAGGGLGESLTALFQEAGLEAPPAAPERPEPAADASERPVAAAVEATHEAVLPATRRSDRHRRLWKRDRKGEPRPAAEAPAADRVPQESPQAEAHETDASETDAPKTEALETKAPEAEASAPSEPPLPPPPSLLEPAAATAPDAIDTLPEAQEVDPSPPAARPSPPPPPGHSRTAAAKRAPATPPAPSKRSRTRLERVPTASAPQAAAAELAALAAPPSAQPADTPLPAPPATEASVPAPVASPVSNGSGPTPDPVDSGLDLESSTAQPATIDPPPVEPEASAAEPPTLVEFVPPAEVPAATNGSHSNGGAMSEAAGEAPAAGARTIACRSCGQPSERGICDVCGEALREMHELSQGLW